MARMDSERMPKKREEFVKLVNGKSMKAAYASLLKELDCKPQEVAQKLRRRTWEDKGVLEILEE